MDEHLLGVCGGDTASKNRKSDEPLVISDVKPGSVAYRTGTISVGDRLLVIDHFRLEGCSVEDAAHILQAAGNIVQLRLQKDDTPEHAEYFRMMIVMVSTSE